MIRLHPKPPRQAGRSQDEAAAKPTPRVVFRQTKPTLHVNVHYNVAFVPRAPASPDSDSSIGTYATSTDSSPAPSRPSSPERLEHAQPEPARIGPPEMPADALDRKWAQVNARVPEAVIHDQVGGLFGAWLLPTASVARKDAMGRRFIEACAARGCQPLMVLDTMHALHRVHEIDAADRAAFSHDRRTDALMILIEICDMGVVREPEDVLKDARRMPWTRLIHFAQAETIGGLTDSLITGSLAAATYQAGISCGQQLVGVKAAGLTAKGVSLGVGAAASGVVTGLGAAATGYYAVNAVKVHYRTVQAFRDVWDNDFSRDAFYMHRVRDHILAARQPEGREPYCKHINSAWTEPGTLFRAKWRNDYRGFDAIN